MVVMRSSGITNGRTAREWGQIGVIITAPIVGNTIGPLADSE